MSKSNEFFNFQNKLMSDDSVLRQSHIDLETRKQISFTTLHSSSHLEKHEQADLLCTPATSTHYSLAQHLGLSRAQKQRSFTHFLVEQNNTKLSVITSREMEHLAKKSRTAISNVL